jgi:hypothetical protein
VVQLAIVAGEVTVVGRSIDDDTVVRGRLRSCLSLVCLVRVGDFVALEKVVLEALRARLAGTGLQSRGEVFDLRQDLVEGAGPLCRGVTEGLGSSLSIGQRSQDEGDESNADEEDVAPHCNWQMSSGMRRGLCRRGGSKGSAVYRRGLPFNVSTYSDNRRV